MATIFWIVEKLERTQATVQDASPGKMVLLYIRSRLSMGQRSSQETVFLLGLDFPEFLFCHPLMDWEL